MDLGNNMSGFVLFSLCSSPNWSYIEMENVLLKRCLLVATPNSKSMKRRYSVFLISIWFFVVLVSKAPIFFHLSWCLYSLIKLLFFKKPDSFTGEREEWTKDLWSRTSNSMTHVFSLDWHEDQERGKTRLRVMTLKHRRLKNP